MHDLTVEYRAGDYTVRPLQGFGTRIEDGQLVTLQGPSGSGKTTLLSCLAGILRPSQGSVLVGDVDVTRLDQEGLVEYRRRGVGIVFQSFNLVPSLTAQDNVAAPLRLSGLSGRAAKRRVTELLERVGLQDRRTHRPGELSGGQQQRVAIARALAFDPPLLLADEPTAHLDYINVESVLVLMRELAVPGRAVVVATHDHRFEHFADATVTMGEPVVHEVAPPSDIGLQPGEILFRQGDPADLVYVIVSGEIEIFRTRTDGTEEHVNTRRAGEYFAELGPMLGIPRTASARAITPAVVHALDLATFRKRLAAEPSLARWNPRLSNV